MFCFGFQSFARFINTNTSYFNTHRLESAENFPETFLSQLEKNKNVIHRPRSVRIRRNCDLGLSTALGLQRRAVLKTSGTVSPNTHLPAGE